MLYVFGAFQAPECTRTGRCWKVNIVGWYRYIPDRFELQKLE